MNVGDLIAAAPELRRKGDPEGALHCAARAAALASAGSDRLLEVQARTQYAQWLHDLGRLAAAEFEAKALRERCAALDDQLCDARMMRLLGSVATTRGDRVEAERQFRASVVIFEKLGADRDLVNALTYLSGLERGDARAVTIERGLALARRIGAADLEGDLLHLRSDHHFSAGRFDAAVADLLIAIDLFERAELVGRLSDACVSLGRILRAHGRYEEAIRYYDRAIELQGRDGDVRSIVQSYNAKAIALAGLNRRVESLASYEKALEVARTSGVQRLIDFQLGNLATAYGETGDYPRAIGILEDVIQRESDPYLLAYRYGALAKLKRETGDITQAVEHIERAIPLARKTNNNDYLPNLHHWASLIYRDAGRTGDSLAAASEGLRIIEEIRSRLVPSDYMKRGFGDRWQELYGVTIGILYQRGDKERALATGEQARARAFLDLLASRNLVDRDAAAPSGTIDLRKGGVASKAAASAVTAEEIAATATRLSSVILSYWVTDDAVFIWVTPPGKPTQAARVAVARKELERLVTASIPSPGRQTTETLRKLHALLIAPVRSSLPAGAPLAIIPHGPLFRVSFAALSDPGGVYLIERHAVSYAPSISTLALTARGGTGARPAKASRYLLVADPSPLPKLTPALAVLPAARRETSEIARLLGPRRAVVLDGPRAGEAQVRTSIAGGARVVHFATHGVIRDDEPFESFLALGAGAAGAASDGRLTVAELYGLDLKADLVVLSACRTATGPPSGDGISGLSRALFYAGASSVLATLWDVADEPSAMLMAGFYRHWQAGMSKRTALRQAQLDLLRALRTGKVTVKTRLGSVPLDEQAHYWAGYILVGES